MSAIDYRLVTAPTIEPITLDQAKAQLRLRGVSDEDAFVRDLIGPAREYCETITRRQFLTATWTATLDEFPRGKDPIRLVGKAPLQSVSSISYIDTAGDTQVWSSSKYIVSTPRDLPGRIRLAFNETYPSTRCEPEAVTITFIAGATAANLVPSVVGQAMKVLITEWYGRGAAATPSKESQDTIKGLLTSVALPEVA